MNTRTQDLQILDVSRESTETLEGKRHREALLSSVYEQSKDPHLEIMRQRLTALIIKGLAAAPNDLNLPPTPRQKKIMAECEYEIEQMEKSIKQYTSSDTFKANLASKVAKVSEFEAQVLMKG